MMTMYLSNFDDRQGLAPQVHTKGITRSCARHLPCHEFLIRLRATFPDVLAHR